MKKYSVTIEAGKSSGQYWCDLWNYRELFIFLAWKDIVVRYKQTILGFMWSIVRPFMTMVVMTVIFGSVAKLPSEGVPYAVLVFAAILPWQFFTSSLITSTASVVSSKTMVAKVYFPRIILPPSAILVNLIDFLIACVIMAGLMAWYGYIPDWRILTLPLFLMLAIGISLGVGLWFTALNVKYRDVQNMVPVLIQLGTYISPVAYSVNVIPEQYRLIYSLNPMVGVIDGFRWAIIGGNFEIYIPGLIISIVFTTLILISGILFFMKTEKTFADVI